jgi:hypothetical protein
MKKITPGMLLDRGPHCWRVRQLQDRYRNPSCYHRSPHAGATITLPGAVTTLPPVPVTLPGSVTTRPATTVSVRHITSTVPPETVAPGGFLPETPAVIKTHANQIEALKGACLSCHGIMGYNEFPTAPFWDGEGNNLSSLHPEPISWWQAQFRTIPGRPPTSALLPVVAQ